MRPAIASISHRTGVLLLIAVSISLLHSLPAGSGWDHAGDYEYRDGHSGGAGSHNHLARLNGGFGFEAWDTSLSPHEVIMSSATSASVHGTGHTDINGKSWSFYSPFQPLTVVRNLDEQHELVPGTVMSFSVENAADVLTVEFGRRGIDSFFRLRALDQQIRLEDDRNLNTGVPMNTPMQVRVTFMNETDYGISLHSLADGSTLLPQTTRQRYDEGDYPRRISVYGWRYFLNDFRLSTTGNVDWEFTGLTVE